MKHNILFFALVICTMGQAQDWHTFHSSQFHPYVVWNSYGNPRCKFKGDIFVRKCATITTCLRNDSDSIC